MWPLDRLPTAQLQAHGLVPDTQALMRATVRLPEGTGSFVSAHGLLLTNHHVVSGCIAALSSPTAPLLQQGFVAHKPAQERRCPGMEVQVLEGIDTLGSELPQAADARKAHLERLVGADCPVGQRCEIASLYGGALMQRYRYRVWNDVRLAFAPENQAANFGGDEDNFNYPRFSFDFALLRVYAGGRPLKPQHWLRPAARPLREGDAVLVSGHPYRTDRLLSVAQLEAQRDALLPDRIARLAAARQTLLSYAQQNPQAARQAQEPLAGLENSLKALRGEWRALQQGDLLAAKRAEEGRVRQAQPAAEPAWQAAARSAQAAAQLSRAEQAQHLPDSLLSELVRLLTLRHERRLPAGERLDAYAAPAAAAMHTRWGAQQPVLPELEAAQWAGQLNFARAQLGAEHPWVRALSATPQLATELAAWLHLTRFAQPSERLALLAQGSDEAVHALAQHEPLLALALRLAPLHRELTRQLETLVQAPLLGQQDAIARARWQVLGDAEPPDANFGLRLSFGRVQGVTTAGLRHPWQTNFGGLYARADAFAGTPPFDLAPRAAAARARIDPREPLNFAATADIVGGNSGSPVLNAVGHWVGLAFDGNLDSLAGQYHFDEPSNRMVALHQRAIALALRRIYGAGTLAVEMGL